MRGDHVFVQRRGYTHHGIDMGDGTVIHCSGGPGRSKSAARVVRESVEDFAVGATVQLRLYGAGKSTVEVTVSRAETKLGHAS
jgi:hypothetical protein